MNRLSCLALVAVAFAASRTAVAQYPYGYGGGYHASTAAEGAARGMADVVRSAGAANLMNSAAAQNYQQAYSSYLDNRLQATDTYFQMRQANTQYRAAAAGPRPTQEDLVRYSESRVPKSLSSSQADPLTGQIAWPIVLTDKAFSDKTAALEKLFADRAAHHGQVTLDEMQDILSLTGSLDEELKARIKDYPPQQYVKAKSFLSSLAYEVNN
ncbi:hypothetical protein [Lignipirellula cremea]|uniref:Uncharacterized protein n=1 Tax=Lignipirellula cremea TaxID=2528010 RepID=A0A518DVQ3_9BACT|nr:hypothetical protein [Lignipirellula cremea]QDU95916.1 hypothetical protein Pla8534_37350 [Lignipirellula cremea]